MSPEEFYEWMSNPGLLDETTLSGLKALTEDYPCFQAARALYLKNLKETGSPEFEQELKKAAIGIPDRKQLYHFLHTGFQGMSKRNKEVADLNIPLYHLGENEESTVKNPLIEKFLNDNSGITRRKNAMSKGEFPEEENPIVKNSVSENDEIITETLAMLYFQQKKYDKALDAFRKLSLKYPEKSVYFATRIEEIEKLKNI